MNTTKFQKIIITVLSLVILFLFGIWGEGVLNLVTALLFPTSEPWAIDGLTNVAMSNYGVNQCNFIQSLTPFMLLLTGILLLFLKNKIGETAFWVSFNLSWIVAIVYLTLFFFAVLFPFFLLMVTLESPPIRIVAVGIDCLIVLGMIVVYNKKSRK